ncbi:biotin synthase BioB [Ruegeria arenilitoris]|uniref:biotin synthase BioB n=1 Tax=Ruegeria arenilitoris TaxID=1173585 RepID=UPI00147D358C|nr:biotin synthase BioB [Ruegeria arenilitoris]
MSNTIKDWELEAAQALHDLPLMDLLFRAQIVHRDNFVPNRIQTSKLLSIKTGGCAEDCAYCSQSALNGAKLPASKLIEVQRVLHEARKAQDAGATRFCMGAAWREPKDRDMDALVEMVKGVRSLGMETCMTLGALDEDKIRRLRDAGLDYYNHNIDTSERYYPQVISTRKFADRIKTLGRVQDAGIKVCSGGILGLGEVTRDRVEMLVTLANMDPAPESVPINMLMPQENTPLADAKPIDPIEFVRVIAMARIMMPRSYVRLSAGRSEMSEAVQAMCFLAGANSIFVGETLLTAQNPEADADAALFAKLGLRVEVAECESRKGEAE